MATISFPDIPDLPGVPAIPRSPNFPPLVKVGLGLVQGALWRAFQVQSQWGIFDQGGNPLGDPSLFTGLIGGVLESIGIGSTLSTNSVEYSKETRVSDFPVEGGIFASYNKVELPAEPRVVLCMQGTEGDRRSFLDDIDQACKSTDLYSVVTPEVTYINYSIERYNYSRMSSKGATLLMVELSLKEVRQVSAQYTKSIQNPKEPGAASQMDNGKVQAQSPPQSTLKSFVNKVGTAVQGLVK